MRLAFDIDGTITANPEVFSFLTNAILQADGEVHIISGQQPGYDILASYQHKKEQLADADVSYTMLFVAPLPDVAGQKAKYCRTKNIDLLIDNKSENIHAVVAAGTDGAHYIHAGSDSEQ